MKKKWVLAGAVLLLAAGLCGYMALTVLNRPRFNAAKLDEVRRGMTRQEVAEVLGSPPGNYEGWWGDGPGGFLTSRTVYPDAYEFEMWSDNDGYYLVYFDNDGHAVRILDKWCDGQKRRTARGEKTYTRVLDGVSSD